jgi:hypothetical protein
LHIRPTLSRTTVLEWSHQLRQHDFREATSLAKRARELSPSLTRRTTVIVLSDLVNPPEAAKMLGDRYRVEVKIAIWHQDDALLIPAGALFREGSEWKTFVLREGKAAATTLDVGRTDGRMTQVINGLEVGAQVLLHPPDSVKDGVAVVKRVVE